MSKKTTKRNRRLIFGKKKRAGRSRQGRITVRRRGGGAKRLYRLVDFNRQPGKATVKRVERDPNRPARIALIEYSNGSQGYILANSQIKVGDKIEMAEKAELKPGNRMKLKHILPGTPIYNIELKVGQGGKLVRSAGNAAQLKAIEDKQALIALPSGELRLTSAACYATVGTLSRPEHSSQKLRKAGQSRHLGRRPKVRGSAMSAGAHPHGGGEGRSPIGLKYPKSPTGRHSKGLKTRKKKKYSDRLITKRKR